MGNTTSGEGEAGVILYQMKPHYKHRCAIVGNNLAHIYWILKLNMIFWYYYLVKAYYENKAILKKKNK